MSKNHPHDNIYSILGKLDALKPTQAEERFALVKEIRESVEAQGSILTGVDAVQAKLAKQFATEDFSKHITSSLKAAASKDKKADEKSNVPANYSTAQVKAELKKRGEKVEEETCNECGMTECSCPHTNEGITTHSKGVTRHEKTDYPGYPTDDTEDSLDSLSGPGGKRGRPRKAQTKNPRPDANAPKKGRGRPVSVKSSPVSMPADPFGRVTGSVPKGRKGTVHSMAEAMDLLGQQLGQLNEGRYLEDANGESLNHILNRFRAEVRNFEQGGDLDKDLYDALYDYYVECGEMPYGVQKARDADPMNWVAERLDIELGNAAYGSDPANAEDAMEAGIPGNLPPEQVPGKEDLLKGKGRSYYEEEVTMEDELNELARLAGLSNEGNAFTGKLKDTAKGDSFELDGKEYTDTSTLDEEPEMEGNAFGKAVRDAKADGVQPGEKVKVGGKEYPVKESDPRKWSMDPKPEDMPKGERQRPAYFEESIEEPGQEDSQFNVTTSMSSDGEKNVTVTATGEHAAGLLQMLKMAGLGSSDKAQELEQEPVSVEVVGGDEGCEEVDEADAPVDQPAEAPVNAPKPEYKSMRASTMGPGEGDNGEKAMNPDRPTFKNGDNALSNPPARGKEVIKAVAALESKLAAEYESIKKVSK